jgi:predicted Zn-dependent protease
MPGFTESEAHALLERVLKLSKAETCESNLNGNAGGNIRYARNSVSTAGATQDTQLVVQSSFGQRVGVATINEFDDASLEKAVRRSEELARLAPEDPEFVGPMGQQTYVTTDCFVEGTAGITPEYRTKVAASSINPSKEQGCVAAGYLQDGSVWQAMMNTAGLFAYHKETNLNFSLTVRSDDGTGSGYVIRDFNDVSRFDPDRASGIALEKAIASREAKAIEPGKYTVILEPEASVDLIQNMVFNIDARSADEGRSFMSKPGGGTKLGEKLLDERITIYTDPAHRDAPTSPWGQDGRPNQKITWVENGVMKNLYYSRYWAKKQDKPAIPFPSNIIIQGGDATIEDLVRDTSRGVLMTRSWYIRFVDPQTVLCTGLTRDGTFYIEDGKIKHAIKNLRWNESPVIMLNNVDALGKQERVVGEAGVPSLIPAMRLRDFTFTSLSDAV